MNTIETFWDSLPGGLAYKSYFYNSLLCISAKEERLKTLRERLKEEETALIEAKKRHVNSVIDCASAAYSPEQVKTALKTAFLNNI